MIIKNHNHYSAHDNEEAIQHFIDSFMNIDGFSLPFKNGKPYKPKHLGRKQSMPGLAHLTQEAIQICLIILVQVIIEA